MLNRTRRSTIARIALALMLFAQAAMAWSACEWLARAPERAVLAAAQHAGCEGLGAERSETPATCLLHCLSEKQSLYKAALDIPAMPSSAVRTIARAVDSLSNTGFRLGLVPAAGTGPPRRILFQSFQV